MNKKQHNGRPVIFGEVLFDCFPDGNSVLGGAPFNVAWHLQGFGLNPLMISSVGTDSRGVQVRELMQEWEMDISGLQTHDRYPTGQVTVSFVDGQPAYDIVADQAYDYIDVNPVSGAVLAEEFSLIYHGSLALRNTHSNATLDALIASSGLPIFLDLNLRNPWWSHDQIIELLKRATWVKLNDEELVEVSRAADIETYIETGFERKSSLETLKLAAQNLVELYDLEQLIVTRGEYGAFVVGRDAMVEGKPLQVSEIVDTVGAGDAFSSVMIRGLIKGWSIESTLEYALSFAAAICQQQGATNRNSALYQ